MFGIGQIIQGHYNEITNKEEDLYQHRIEICKKCELISKNSFGYICDSKKCINTKTNSIRIKIHIHKKFEFNDVNNK